jgi:integrase
MGTDFFASSAEERAVFASIIPELRRRGITLKDVLAAGVKQAVFTRRTVDEVVAELLELKRQRWDAGELRDRSYNDLRQRMGRIALHFRGKQLGDLTVQDLKAWAVGLRLARRTTKNFINVASELFNFAVQRRYLPESPLKYLGREDRLAMYGVPAEEHSVAIFTPSQAEKLLRTAETHLTELIASLALGLFAGVRSSELQQLAWSDITLDGPYPTVRISGEVAKKRKRRFIPLSLT